MYKKQTKCAKNEQMWCKCVAKLQASECDACRCNVCKWWGSDVCNKWWGSTANDVKLREKCVKCSK